jgi:hypothetical protein
MAAGASGALMISRVIGVGAGGSNKVHPLSTTKGRASKKWRMVRSPSGLMILIL